MLLNGPNRVSSLLEVLLRFRGSSIAIAADIGEMFLQLEIPEADRDYLRFLWWETDTRDKLPEYRMTVHPFGATSSPFCANYALRQAISVFTEDAPDLRYVIDRCFYVDDCLASFDEITSAQRFVTEIRVALLKAGFKFTKILSNSKGVLEGIKPFNRAPTMRDLLVDAPLVKRILCLQWDVATDTLRFVVNDVNKPITRKGTLSHLSSPFDYLWLVAPFVICAKQMFQMTCESKLGWDDPVGDVIANRWLEWIRNLSWISSISVPRSLKPIRDYQIIELHELCDASESGYGVVTYIHSKVNNKLELRLLFGKARVALMKAVTISGLELSAASTAVRIYSVVREELDISPVKTTFWTDSMIVIYYLRNESNRYSCFVANRVAIIREVTKKDQWRHVPSRLNPADLAPRGTMDVNVLNENEWPTFFKEPGDKWPNKEEEPIVCETSLELKSNMALIQTNVKRSAQRPLLEYYSGWYRLLKPIAWLLRYVKYIKIMYGGELNNSLNVGRLTIAELRSAETVIVKATQWKTWGNVRTNASSGYLKLKVLLESLNPIIVNEVVCVGRRLNGSMSPRYTLLIILPSDHPTSHLMFRHYHSTEGHLKTTQVLASIRAKYWILKGKTTTIRVVSRCMECRKRNAHLGQQLTGPLLSWKIEVGNYSFEYVGIDLFEPFGLRRGRGTCKRYSCLFTCLKMRAVHIEMVHTLSIGAFLLALLRFINRRGLQRVIFCDRGIDIVGGNMELQKWLEDSEDKIHEELMKRDIEWKFNRPNASHRGGLCERLIGIIKRVLGAMIKGQSLTDKTLETFLSEAERISNNRSLQLVTDDVKDFDVLTHNKLLLIRCNEGFCVDDCWENPVARRWKQAKHMASTFCHRWLMEYVTTVQTRDKWKKPRRNLQVGDIVLVADKSTSDRWPLSIVNEFCTGEDNLLRTVEAKTRSGLLTRDVRRLCLLEGCDERQIKIHEVDV
uniref:Pol polyprotein n=1 Tax=Schistosoma japonicum TaxID=6182 RepID=C7C1Z5_SCHJA|nr:pol polyprotein [Schistosoma japonicum]